MAESPVLRFPVSGQEEGSFLLEVSSNGSRPLDLKLIGSESTAVFLLKLRHKKIDEYKASPSHCTDEEWEQILTSIFVHLKPLPDIEVRADVQSDGNAVTLSFRKNIQGITQRLGSIKLDENDKTEISPFDWCVSAIASRAQVREELAAARARIELLEESVKELKAQLEDFIASKQEDETQILEKFRDLLNEKKLKIRQQQRLLAAAKVDPKKLANLGGGGGESESESEIEHRDAGPSRSGKRKKAQMKDGDEDDESEDGFEKMDVDEQPQLDSDVDENQQSTTDNDNNATASDPDSDGEAPRIAEVRKRKKAVSPPRQSSSRSARSASSSKPSRNTRAATQTKATPASASDSEDEALPPPRELPFMRSKKSAPPPKPVDDDDETASDDDSEL